MLPLIKSSIIMCMPCTAGRMSRMSSLAALLFPALALAQVPHITTNGNNINVVTGSGGYVN